MGEIVYIEKDEAAAALRAAAFTDGARQVVHSFAHTGFVALGADHELDDALADLERADRVAWIDHPLGHDLAVLTADHVCYFAAKRPELRPDPPRASDYPRRDA